jgi:hypothetical protein
MVKSTHLLGWRESTSSSTEPSGSLESFAPPAGTLVGGSGPHGVPQTAPVSSLRAADSPRLAGLSDEHINMLAALECQLPPILVHRPTMQIIDGMHRLQAAILRGDSTIAVEFFDGSRQDAFLHAVRANVEHGLPLTHADRVAAVVRIIASHPQLSDRAIAQVAGVSAPTVGSIRRRTTTGGAPQVERIGRDGRVRPLNGAMGRRRASEMIRRRPEASLREIAHEAGVSVGTVRDVRHRMRRGEDPVPRGLGHERRSPVPAGGPHPPAIEHVETGLRTSRYGEIIENLCKDPSLRFNQNGRNLLQWLGINLIPRENIAVFADAIPPHCTKTLAELARGSAEMWTRLAEQLDRRARGIE